MQYIQTKHQTNQPDVSKLTDVLTLYLIASDLLIWFRLKTQNNVKIKTLSHQVVKEM